MPFDFITPSNSLGAIIIVYFREKGAWSLQLAGYGPHLSLLNSEMPPLDYCVCCAEAIECFRIFTVYGHKHVRSHKYEVEVKVAKLCPILCDPMDYTVHGILQARILE